jgi:hypothetical protein
MRRVLASLICSALTAALFVVPMPVPAAAAPPPLRVGCIVSQQTETYYTRHYKGVSALVRQNATITYLRSKGWDVTQLGDADIVDAATLLQRYDVIVLTMNFAMNGNPGRQLQRYVEAGGAVVALLASPRIAPEADVSPNSVIPEHWWKILNTNTYEWGPLSEAYQTLFINDPDGNYTVSPWPGTEHPIVSSTRQLLVDRGQGGLSMSLDREGSAHRAGTLELSSLLRNNLNARPVLTVTSRDSRLLNGYSWWPAYPRIGTPGVYPAAVAANYGKGRTVYFEFCPVDFLPQCNYAHIGSPSGTDADVAGAYIESAIAWAGTKGGHFGRIQRGGRTRAEIDVYGDGIYTRQYVGNIGNVSCVGPVATRIYNPSGRLVFTANYAGKYIGAAPGQEFRYCSSYVPGSLAAGSYRVEVEYKYSYPGWTNAWKEIAYVRRSQGRNIRSSIWGASKPVIYGATVLPKTITPNGDGVDETAYLDFLVDKPCNLSAKVYDSRWNLITTLLLPRAQAPGLAGVKWNGRNSLGRVVAAGTYRMAVYASNTAGQNSLGAFVTVVR